MHRHTNIVDALIAYIDEIVNHQAQLKVVLELKQNQLSSLERDKHHVKTVNKECVNREIDLCQIDLKLLNSLVLADAEIIKRLTGILDLNTQGN